MFLRDLHLVAMVVNDLNGRYVCTFARRKLVMRAGETDRAITVKSDQLEKQGTATIVKRLFDIADAKAFRKGWLILT